MAIIIFLPETARSVVDNGSIPTRGIHRCPFPPMIGELTSEEDIATPPPSKPQWHVPSPLTCLYVLFRKDTLIVAISIGIFYSAYSCIQASLSTLFIRIYHFKELQAGLIYLPFGFGCALAAYVTGESDMTI
jgi:hypothetical protein